jgi:hypothetical protein
MKRIKKSFEEGKKQLLSTAGAERNRDPMKKQQ